MNEEGAPPGPPIAVLVALVGIGSLVALPLRVTPAFAEIAGRVSLSLLGRLATSSWFPPLLALAPSAVLLHAWHVRRLSAARAVRLSRGAAALALAALCLCLAGLAELLLRGS